MEIFSFGDRIKEIRKRAELTQKEFAQKLGTSQGYVSEVERGDKLPGCDFLQSLRRYFWVDLNLLLSEGGQSQEPTISETAQSYEPTEKETRLLAAFTQLDDVRQNRIIFAAEDAALAFDRIRGKENEGSGWKESRSERKSVG